MDYEVAFKFTVVSKKSKFIGKSGVCDITTNETPEALKDSEELKSLIAADMNRKTKMGVLLVEITNIKQK